MGNIDTKSENLIKVFRESVKSGYRTRADIAKETGLSVMSVGYFTDKLIEMNLLNQSYKSIKRSGRRSRYITAKKIYKSLIISLNEQGFSAYIIDLQNNVDVNMTKESDNTFTYEDDLRKFTASAYDMYLSEAKKLSYRMGIGIVIDGEYDEKSGYAVLSRHNSLLKININKLFAECLNEEKIYITDGYSCFLENISKSEKQNSLLFSLFIDENIKCASFRSGDSNIKMLSCGEFNYFADSSIDKMLSGTYDVDKQIDILLNLIMTVLFTSAPDKVYITGNRYSDISAMGEILKQKIQSECLSRKLKIPCFIIIGDSLIKEKSTAAEIAERWFINTVLNKEITE